MAITVAAVYLYHAIQKGNKDRLQLEQRVREEQQLQFEQLKGSNSSQDEKIKELENKLQSKIAEKARLASVEASKTSVVAQVVAKAIPVAKAAPVDSNSAKMFIYMKESGNRTNAINKSSGACGLGQALPCSKMGCSLTDYACQDAFFTRYMLARYGSWENAQAFWLAHHWW